MKGIFILIFTFMLLPGCATPYQRQDLRGGYSDFALNKDIYQVSFNGNGYTSRARVKRFLLYRCAELTIGNGYDYFVIVKADTGVSQSFITTPGRFNATTNFVGDSAYTSGSYSPGTATPVYKHSAIVTIKLFRGKKPEDDPAAFDAAFLIRNMNPE